MSMEAMLDEERKEILALLEGNTVSRSLQSQSPLGMRSASPYASPRSPVRSMLDIGDDTASISSTGAKKSPPRMAPMVPVRSMLDFDSPPPPPAAAPIRSMLDVDSPSPPLTRQLHSGPTSPIDLNTRTHGANNTVHPRSLSDSAPPKPSSFGPRSSVTRLDPTAEYQFSDIYSSNTAAPSMPKRNTQLGKNQGGKRSMGVMADALRGNDIALPGDRGRHHSVAGPSIRPGNKSKSPHNRLGLRSNSPHASLLSNSVKGGSNSGNMFMLDDGRVVDLSNAYRRLSDANLVFSGGTLSQLPSRKRSGQQDDGFPGRLEKDYLSPDGEELEDSSDDDHQTSSEDEGERGRRKDPREFEDDAASEPVKPKPAVTSASKPARKTLSLLAAAEQERQEVEQLQPKYQYRSLLEPDITVTAPTGEKTKPVKTGVHPSTSYDHGPASEYALANESEDDQEVSEIKRAQNLSFSMTPIIQHPEYNRSIRMIYRGEYSKIVQQMEEEHHRIRKYLVATDLSDESTHALEWAIGTVLRDGDTLIAIYCVDEETGIVGEAGLAPDESSAIKEQAAAINAVTSIRTPPVSTSTLSAFPHPQRVSVLSMNTDASSINLSPHASTSRERSKGEDERRRAVMDISDRVTRLLRKTQLQVRVIVEVIHCKNPKHLITEVIDLINPTLVILGSRGRSALKG
jgi:nucleotide-binding universal stress UspA family protein